MTIADGGRSGSAAVRASVCTRRGEQVGTGRVGQDFRIRIGQVTGEPELNAKCVQFLR